MGRLEVPDAIMNSGNCNTQTWETDFPQTGTNIWDFWSWWIITLLHQWTYILIRHWHADWLCRCL